jgi:hypothetical protein
MGNGELFRPTIFYDSTEAPKFKFKFTLIIIFCFDFNAFHFRKKSRSRSLIYATTNKYLLFNAAAFLCHRRCADP